jgi:AcrR family transcriptional regulator
MIYYYFGGKEQLYIAVLEDQYTRIRDAESALGLDGLPPEQAVRRLAEFTFDYDHAHPEFVRLVAVENIHHARHLRKSARIRSVNARIIGTIERILKRGRRQRVFAATVRAVGVTSSSIATVDTLCGIVTSAPRRFVIVNSGRRNAG